jgi:hypothetical protein
MINPFYRIIGLAVLAAGLFPARAAGPPSRSTGEVSFEHSGSSDLSQGTLAAGSLASSRLGLRWNAGQRLSLGDWQLGAGISYELRSLEHAGAALLPDDLHGIAGRLVVTRRWNRVFLLAGFAPGIYSDMEDLSWDDLNAPGTVAVSFTLRSDLDLLLGLRFDPRNELPLVGGPGLRWKITPDWTLNLAIPNPHLAWRSHRSLLWTLGGELVGGSYRVSDDFGSRRGDARLDGVQLTYREIRSALGCRWDLNEHMGLSLSAGVVLHRRAGYDDRRLQYGTDPAPFGRIRLDVAF